MAGDSTTEELANRAPHANASRGQHSNSGQPTKSVRSHPQQSHSGDQGTPIGSLLAGVLVLGALIALMSYIIRGPGFPRGSPGRAARSGKTGAKAGNRTTLEIVLGVFAIANLVTSTSADKLGGGLLSALMLVLVVGFAFFLTNAGLVIAVLGLVAAVLDVSLDQGAATTTMVGLIAVMLGFLFGAARSIGRT